MSNLKMNCGYCGRKCSLDKDFCIPQDSVYICKSCYDWKQKVDDLEAKLAEKDIEIERLKQNYDEVWEDAYFSVRENFELNNNCNECRRCYAEEFNKQLAEKEKEEIKRMGDFEKRCQEYYGTDKYKRDFAITKLEKVKAFIIKNNEPTPKMIKITRFINEQVNRLKGEINGKNSKI